MVFSVYNASNKLVVMTCYWREAANLVEYLRRKTPAGCSLEIDGEPVDGDTVERLLHATATPGFFREPTRDDIAWARSGA